MIDKTVKGGRTMKIAVPLFQERVAPYFGSFSKMLLVEMVGEKIASKSTREVGEQGAMQITRSLVSSGVNILICGGIQRVHKQWLTHQGVLVVDNQRGNAEELLAQMIGHEAFCRPEPGGKVYSTRSRRRSWPPLNAIGNAGIKKLIKKENKRG
jgi:predicted Fe-Mo cluster-binding NifX family protein